MVRPFVVIGACSSVFSAPFVLKCVYYVYLPFRSSRYWMVIKGFDINNENKLKLFASMKFEGKKVL